MTEKKTFSFYILEKLNSVDPIQKTFC